MPPPLPPITSLLRHRPPFLFLAHLIEVAPSTLTARFAASATTRPALLDGLGQASAALLRLTPTYAKLPTPVFAGMEDLVFAPGRGGVDPATVLVTVTLAAARRRYGVVNAVAYVPIGDSGGGAGGRRSGRLHGGKGAPTAAAWAGTVEVARGKLLFSFLD